MAPPCRNPHTPTLSLWAVAAFETRREIGCILLPKVPCGIHFRWVNFTPSSNVFVKQPAGPSRWPRVARLTAPKLVNSTKLARLHFSIRDNIFQVNFLLTSLSFLSFITLRRNSAACIGVLSRVLLLVHLKKEEYRGKVHCLWLTFHFYSPFQQSNMVLYKVQCPKIDNRFKNERGQLWWKV